MANTNDSVVAIFPSHTAAEAAIKTGKFVLLVHGTAEEASHAKDMLNRTLPEYLEHHQ